MSPEVAAWMLLLAMVVFALQHLPFINIDLAIRLQIWAKEQIRKLEQEIEELRRYRE